MNFLPLTRPTWPRAATLLLALLAAPAAQAEPAAPPATTPDALPERPTPAATPTAAPSAAPSAFAAPAVAASRLATQRGGSASSVVDQVGRVSDATASQVTTGNNAIRGGAFAHAAGLTTVIQNSGANVVIQSATTVNLQFK